MTTNELTKTIWMLLLNEGGRWTAAGIADRIGDETKAVSDTLSRIARKGLCKDGRAEGHRRMVYWVDGTCIIPQGMAVAEVQES